MCQRSRHCFPMRPGRLEAMSDHFFAPYFFTSSTTFRSSSSVQGPLTRVGLSTFCHRCKHCTSDLWGSLCDISFQFLAPCSSTAVRRASSSCLVHLIPVFFPLEETPLLLPPLFSSLWPTDDGVDFFPEEQMDIFLGF